MIDKLYSNLSTTPEETDKDESLQLVIKDNIKGWTINKPKILTQIIKYCMLLLLFQPSNSSL